MAQDEISEDLIGKYKHEGEQGDAMEFDEVFEEEELESSDEDRVRNLRVSLDASRKINFDRLIRGYRTEAVYAMSSERGPYIFLANTIQELSNAITVLMGSGNQDKKYDSKRLSGWKICLVTVKPSVDEDQFKKKVEHLTFSMMQRGYQDKRLDTINFYYKEQIARVDATVFDTFFLVRMTWALDHRLITDFLRADPDASNSIQAIDVRRVQTSYHSPGSWRFLESSVSATFGSQFKEMQLLTNSRQRFCTHIEAFKNRTDPIHLYFNDQLHLDINDQRAYLPRIATVDQNRFPTRPRARTIEVWMHLLYAMRKQNKLTNKEDAAAIDYLTTMLFMSQSLLCDPQGRSFFMIMSRPSLSRNEATQFKLLLDHVYKDSPFTLTFAVSDRPDSEATSLADLVDAPDMELLCAMAAFVDSEAPLLGDIKALSSHAYLFPMVVLETARVNSAETLGLAAAILYPYRESVRNILSPKNIDLEREYILLLHYLTHYEAPRSGRIKVLPPAYTGKGVTLEMVDVRKIFPEYHFETLVGNRIQLTAMLSIDQILYLCWRELNDTYQDLDLATFISDGYGDRYIANSLESVDELAEDAFWVPLILRAYHDSRVPKSDRLELLAHLTRAIADRYGNNRTRTSRVRKDQRKTLQLTLDTEKERFEKTTERAEYDTYLREYWLTASSRDIIDEHYDPYLSDLRRYGLDIDAVINATQVYTIIDKKHPRPIAGQDSKIVRWVSSAPLDTENFVHRTDWVVTKQSILPFVAWTCQFSLATANEVFIVDEYTRKLFTRFPVSTGAWLPMAISGLTKPKWHLTVPLDSLKSELREAYATKLETYNNALKGDTWLAFSMQHILMLYPHNYYLLFLLANGMFDMAYEYIERSNLFLVNVDDEEFYDKVFLFRTDKLARDRRSIPPIFEDITMATFVIGLGVRNGIEPGYLDSLEKRVETEDIFKIFFSNKSLDSKMFRYRPGLVAFTEAARIGHPKLLELLFYGVNFARVKLGLTREDKDFAIERGGFAKVFMHTTELPKCYYTLPPPFRLMTPWNLLQTHLLVDQVSALDNLAETTNRVTYDPRIIDLFQDFDFEASATIPIIDVDKHFTHHVQNLVKERSTLERERNEERTSVQRRLDKTTLLSVTRSMIAESRHNRPTYYGANSNIDLDASKDHIYRDAVHFLPEVRDYDSDEDLPVLEIPKDVKILELSALDTQAILIKMVSQMRDGVDADLMLASHRRMWQNLHVAALKRSDLTLTPQQLTIPFGIGEEGEEEGDEGGYLAASPNNETQANIPAYQIGTPFHVIADKIAAESKVFGDNSDEEEGEEEEEERSHIAHDGDVDLSELEENNKERANRELSESRDLSSSVNSMESVDEQDEASASDSVSLSSQYFPPRQILSPLQTFGEIKDDEENKWYHDVVNDASSTINLLISETSDLLNVEIRRVMHSLLSTLAIPVVLGLIAQRVRTFVTVVARLKAGYTKSFLTAEKTREVQQRLAIELAEPMVIRFESIWSSLLTGLEMLSNDNVMMPMMLEGICDALKSALLLTARPSGENKSLLTSEDIDRWIQRSKLKYSAKKLQPTATFDETQITFPEEELVYALRPQIFAPKSRIILNVNSDGEGGEEPMPGDTILTLQKNARETLESVTYLRSRIAVHRETESTIEPSIATFASDFVREFNLTNKGARGEGHPMFVALNDRENPVRFTTNTSNPREVVAAIEKICGAPLYTVGSKHVTATLNHYLSRHVDRLVLDILFQRQDRTLKAWVATMRAFAVPTQADNTGPTAADRGIVFDAIFNTKTGKPSKSHERFISILSSGKEVQYDSLTEGLIVLLFGNATERHLSHANNKEHVMECLYELAASCIVPK